MTMVEEEDEGGSISSKTNTSPSAPHPSVMVGPVPGPGPGPGPGPVIATGEGEPLRRPRRPRFESSASDDGGGADGHGRVDMDNASPASSSSSSSWAPSDSSSSSEAPPPSASSHQISGQDDNLLLQQRGLSSAGRDGDGDGIFVDGTGKGIHVPSSGGSSSVLRSGTGAGAVEVEPTKTKADPAPRHVTWSSLSLGSDSKPPPPVSSSILRGSMCVRIGGGGGNVSATPTPPHPHQQSESRRVRYARMSSILSSGYALIDSLPPTTEEQQEERRRRRWDRNPSDVVDVDEGRMAGTGTADATADHGWNLAGASPSSIGSDGSDGGSLQSSSGTRSTTATSRHRHRHHLHLHAHRHRPPHAHEAVEPFISSLAKSVEILMKHSSSAVHASSTPGGSGGKDNLLAHFDQEKERSDGGRRRSRRLHRGPRTSFFSFLRILCPTKTQLLTLLHLSAFSVLGEALRVFLGRLFGGECRDGDTPWLYAIVTTANVCVTSDGSSPMGGAVFTDLPANMFGSFLMGLAQPTRDLGLLADVPVSFIPSRHWFQSWTVVHLGFRTGFCGALTTLASWNAQMVAMIDGTATSSPSQSQSQFFSAVFGYVIGLEVAMASFRLGQVAAVWLHRFTNPRLAREEDVLMFAYSRADDGGAYSGGASSSVVGKKALPDYERRYLRTLLPREQRLWAEQNLSALEDLERWKISTDRYRAREFVDPAATHHGSSYDVLVALHEIERKVLVDEEEPGDDLIRIAERLGWDVESLNRFAREANVALHSSSSTAIAAEHDVVSSSSSASSLVLQNLIMSVPPVLAVALLVGFAVLEYSTIESSEFYRHMWLSALLAPFGTVLRWKLSSLNGGGAGGSSRWMWFPLGTFTANIVASVISALTQGLMDSPFEFDLATEQMLSAIKTGFAGSMSTVSTFVAESCMLQKSFPHHAKAYYYMVGTLMCACVAGLIIYSPIVRSG